MGSRDEVAPDLSLDGYNITERNESCAHALYLKMNRLDERIKLFEQCAWVGRRVRNKWDASAEAPFPVRIEYELLWLTETVLTIEQGSLVFPENSCGKIKRSRCWRDNK